jgi:hypothetical protein
MISVLILICSISIPPQNCDSSNALATLHGGKTASVAGCGVEGQAFLARSPLKPDPAREYAKIECLRGERARS